MRFLGLFFRFHFFRLPVGVGAAGTLLPAIRRSFSLANSNDLAILFLITEISCGVCVIAGCLQLSHWISIEIISLHVAHRFTRQGYPFDLCRYRFTSLLSIDPL